MLLLLPFTPPLIADDTSSTVALRFPLPSARSRSARNFSEADLTLTNNRGCGLSARPLKSSLSLQILSFELDMETQYFREQAQRVRGIAEKADPLPKKRLLILVEHYD